MQNEFDADAIIHFGTHGNLEFTPGKNAALSKSDWADVLIGGLTAFLFLYHWKHRRGYHCQKKIPCRDCYPSYTTLHKKRATAKICIPSDENT